MEDKVAAQVITKYLKKGNMARCLRDILPSSNLSKKQRENIADIVHTVVRWKRLFEHIIETRGLPGSAETYVRLARDGAQTNASSYPFEYRYSCSSYVASILKDHGDWAEYLNETPPTTLCVNFNKSTTRMRLFLFFNRILFLLSVLFSRPLFLPPRLVNIQKSSRNALRMSKMRTVNSSRISQHS